MRNLVVLGSQNQDVLFSCQRLILSPDGSDNSELTFRIAATTIWSSPRLFILYITFLLRWSSTEPSQGVSLDAGVFPTDVRRVILNKQRSNKYNIDHV